MNIRGKLETAANAATILAALVLSFVLIKVYLLPSALHRPIRNASATAVGTSMKDRIEGVDWQKNGRTLVLALSTQCHFCTASAPFFRTLVSQARKSVKIVAVLPQPVKTGQEYLSAEGVRVDFVTQSSLSRIGISGTPTMLLVNSAGRVTNVWVGMLKPKEQEQVFRVLGLPQVRAESVAPHAPRATKLVHSVRAQKVRSSGAEYGG
jgi:hypothetical protein